MTWCKRLSLQLILGLFAFESVGLEVKNSGGRIYLTDPSCAEVAEVTRSLATWTTNLGIQKRCPFDKKKPRSAPLPWSDCSFDITNCVPDHVVKFHGATPEISGPNCWNLALVMSDILPALRYSTPEEMAFYMRPPLCRSLKNGEPRIPGDIGAIRSVGTGDSLESHGFIYVSEKIAYSKNGFLRRSPYALQPLENVYNQYKVPRISDCRANELNTSVECDNSVSYFRCISMDQYLDEHPKIPSELKRSLNELSNFETCLQARVLSGTTLSEIAQNNIINVAAGLATYLDQESKKQSQPADEQRKFLLGALQLRLKAILDQLEISGDSSLRNSLAPIISAVEYDALILRATK